MRPHSFNSGTPKPADVFLLPLTMKDDSIDGIYDTLKQTAKISQSAGGMGCLFTIFEPPAPISLNQWHFQWYCAHAQGFQ